MKLLLTFAVFCLLGQSFAATVGAANVGTIQASNLCTAVATGTVASGCATTADAAGSSTKCCLLTFTSITYNAVAMIKGASGGATAKIFCYKKGTNFIFQES